MKVLVSGASGLIGSAVVAELTISGHDVFTLGRKPPSPELKGFQWNVENKSGDLSDIDSLDAVIHLAGQSIASKRWSPEEKSRIVSSRIEGTKFLIELLKNANLHPSIFIGGSASGVYGDRGKEELGENSPPGSGFLADLVQKWEFETSKAQDTAQRIAIIRTGVVLSTYGGALARQLPMFRYGLGSALGTGSQFMSWIHLEDEVRAILYILENEKLSGPINLVSPNPTSNLEFSKTMAKVLQRPMFLKAPAKMLELALGKEFADELLLFSQRIIPNKLEDAGFEFHFPLLEGALLDLLR